MKAIITILSVSRAIQSKSTKRLSLGALSLCSQIKIASPFAKAFTYSQAHRYATMTSDQPQPVDMTLLHPATATSESNLTNSVPAGKVVLAPMVRSGELPTRLLALDYGADLVWGPETIDRAIIGCTRTENSAIGCVDYKKGERLVFRTHPAREKSKFIFQIGTASPELAVEAAKAISQDVAGIDVNAGCPKHFSIHAGMGAGLLKNPTNLHAVLNSLIANLGPSTSYNVPISVKIRLLDTIEETHALITSLCKTGISSLTLHCRTIPMRPRERAIRDAVQGAADICRSHNVKFFINGDIADRDHAEEIIRQYNINGGAMIAVAAEANPSVFLSKKAGYELKEWKELAQEYLRTAMAVDNPIANTKFCIMHLVPGRLEAHQEMSKLKTYRSMCQYLGVECTIAEENDLGTLKTRKAAELKAREEEAKRGKEERQRKKAEDSKKQGQVAKAAGGAFGRDKERNKLAERGVARIKSPERTDESASLDAVVQGRQLEI